MHAAAEEDPRAFGRGGDGVGEARELFAVSDDERLLGVGAACGRGVDVLRRRRFGLLHRRRHHGRDVGGVVLLRSLVGDGGRAALFDPLQRLGQHHRQVDDVLLPPPRLLLPLAELLAEVDVVVVAALQQRAHELVTLRLDLLGVDQVDREDEIVASDRFLVLEEELELTAALGPSEVARRDDRHEQLRAAAHGFVDAPPVVLAPLDRRLVDEELAVDR